MSETPDFNLPINDGAASVPVFDCHVILTPPEQPGEDFRARVANLSRISASAGTERDCLRKIVEQFKSFLKATLESSGRIEWDPSQTPAAGEIERWIPVHL